ncbi:MAG: P1 family peptidase [Thermoleophilaceae bacterium]|nr:P1 family peptidase [Thermoleophilaceae bacterium]
MDARSLRDHGLRIGTLEPGPASSIADVSGVRVGHVTVVRDEPDPPEGRGTARSGVTVVLPGEPSSLLAQPVPAGVAVLNGAGELTGSHEVREWGTFDTPVYLTATMSVGRVYDGAVTAAVAADPRVGVDDVVIPVVGECDDSWLNDARVVQVEAADAQRAVDAASAGFATGAVGAGTGMMCFEWKGGIGTASRVAPDGSAVGALVLANFGARSDLVVGGVPVGRLIGGSGWGPDPAGSCIVVVATDAPMTSAQLERLARRAGLGLARTGSVAHDGSGEIFIGFSVGSRVPRGDPPAPGAPRSSLDGLFQAAVEATEEAVLCALWTAETTTGRNGRVAEALPHERVLELLRSHGRLAS